MKIAAPRRVSHSYVQQLVASPAEVFPLLCPVREAEWLEGWDPVEVWSRSGAQPTAARRAATYPPAVGGWFFSRRMR